MSHRVKPRTGPGRELSSAASDGKASVTNPERSERAPKLPLCENRYLRTASQYYALIALCARARWDQVGSVQRAAACLAPLAFRHMRCRFPVSHAVAKRFLTTLQEGIDAFERRFRKRSCRWDACAKAPEVAATASVTENSRSDRIFIELTSPQSSTITSEA
jgi:hypothetical protein